MDNYTFISSDQKSNVYTRIWPIDNNIQGIIVVLHGLGDHIDNYDEFASTMNRNNYIVCGLDMIGFGKTTDISKIGYYENRKEAYKNIVEDVNTYIKKIKETYNNIPVYILGFSFGSVVARSYINNYSNDITGCILIGSPYIDTKFMRFCRFYTSYLAVGKGWDDRNVYLYKKTIENFNKTFENKQIPSWLNTNVSALMRIKDDPYATARLTLSGYYVLYDLILRSESKKAIKNIRKDLPILIMSGKDDPVTSFGNDVYTYNKLFTSNQITNVTFKIYNNMRHDILNEYNKDIPLNDILKFLNTNK